MTRTPLAVGEVFNSLHDCDRLISEQLIDYLRMTIVHGGGITALRRVADFAAHYGVRTGFHGANDLSPITMGAALHFGRWVPNFGAHAVFDWDWQVRDGYLLSGEKPGHGVEFDEDEAARHPYKRRYLDVNRLTDGTLWSW
jgi:mannonate dehydratase